jgi:hypothetical protein
VSEAALGPDQAAAVALGNAAESGIGSSLQVLARMCDELRIEAESTAAIDEMVALTVGRDRGAMHLVLHPTTFL